MNPAATIGIVSAVLAIASGVLALRLSQAPGSGDQRWFAVIAFTSAAYAACNLPTTLAAAPPVVVWLSRVQVTAVAVNVWGWIGLSRTLAGVAASRLEQRASWALLAAAPLPLLPGVVCGGAVVDRPYPPLDVIYRVPLTTPGGDAIFALLALIGLALEVRLVRAALRRVPGAGVLATAFALILAMGVSDALATSFLLPLPFLLDSAFVAPLLAVSWIGASRFISSATELEALGRELWSQVEARTRELASAQESLLQAEKLAALGQFANGVAHEVNNPASVVTASLQFISRGAGEPGGRPLDHESAEALGDALAAMERITTLVRKLVDAGRVALAPSRASKADVGLAIAKAIQLQPEPARDQIRVLGEPDGVEVALRPDALEHVLDALLANAVDASDGREPRIAIGTERRGGAVRISVSDEGVGMDPEVLRRAFDPFFTTKPFGRGTGLSLPVARGLVEGAGGSLWLESEPGAGTLAVVELPEPRRREDVPAREA